MSGLIKTHTVGSETPNFLASEVGLVRKTYQLNKADYVSSDYVAKAGTVVLAGGSPVGILFQDVDLANGDNLGSVIIAGRVYENRLPSGYATHKDALIAKGLFFDTMPETTRE